MSTLIDWLFPGIVTLIGCILLYPVSKELGNSFRKIFVNQDKGEKE